MLKIMLHIVRSDGKRNNNNRRTTLKQNIIVGTRARDVDVEYLKSLHFLRSPTRYYIPTRYATECSN